jgi:REP element-mobilizing transposase RayT
MKEFYRRNLPHYQPNNAVLFMTVRLYGSIPKNKLQSLKDAREVEAYRLKKLELSKDELEKALKNNRDLYFGKFDDLLDNNKEGVHWLKSDKVAQTWISALKHFDGKRYVVICSTIMSNHVHFIFYKLDRALSKVMKTMKSYSAYEANKILIDEFPDRMKNESFWQSESFDRSIRNRTELANKINYTLNNPVKIGLVTHWKDWKWNYIHPDFIKFIEEK